MNISLVNNYINTRTLDLDIEQIKSSCDLMQKFIGDKFTGSDEFYKDDTSPITTNLFTSYNLMLYPLPGFHDLFNEIKETFHAVRNYNNISYDKFYMQCWLNVYKAGQHLEWHDHWHPKFQAWHGFYCVNVGDSKTTYKLPNNEIVDIKSEENLLVLSKSDGDLHKSSEWQDLDNDRITIAFDIVPDHWIRWDSNVNHWIPI